MSVWILKMKRNLIGVLRRFGIYKRLLWGFGLAFVLPILVIGGFNSVYSFRQNEAEAKKFLEDSSSQIADNVSDYLYYHMELLDVVAENKDIIRNLKAYKTQDWDGKSSAENYIRLILGHTFGLGGAVNTCEMVSVEGAYFYYPSPISSGDFNKSTILTKEADEVGFAVRKKEIKSDGRNYIILNRSIYDDGDICVGVLMTALNLEFFNRVCLENVNNLHNQVFILDQSKKIISASDESLVDTTYDADSSHILSISKPIEGTDLTLVNQIDYAILLETALVQLTITLLMALLLAVVAMMLAVIFTQSITRPVDHLLQEMNKEGIDKHVDDSGGDEHHVMIEGFNKMNDRIVNTLQNHYDLKLQETKLNALRKEAELSALQQQINPHFLYNTLESIYWSGQLEGDEEISDIVNALGNYLRAIISKGREYVWVSTEMDSVNNYIFLQNKRFQNRILCKWEISEHARHCKVLKLFLQPIIEDIVSGCMDYIEDTIRLQISLYREDEILFGLLSGAGLGDYMRLLQQNKVEISGIQSVKERLNLYYGESYGVFMDWKEEEIRLSLPLFKEG